MNYLESILPVGRKNAIHQKDLAAKLGVSPDAAKYMVRMARQSGVQILSGIDGYWIAETEQEKLLYIRMMRKSAFSRLKNANRIKSTLNDIDGQISLLDAENGASEGV